MFCTSFTCSRVDPILSELTWDSAAPHLSPNICHWRESIFVQTKGLYSHVLCLCLSARITFYSRDIISVHAIRCANIKYVMQKHTNDIITFDKINPYFFSFFFSPLLLTWPVRVNTPSHDRNEMKMLRKHELFEQIMNEIQINANKCV